MPAPPFPSCHSPSDGSPEPSSFNAELTTAGGDIWSIDPLGLALSSHVLFLYSDHFDGSGSPRCHSSPMRVAREVRIFPLLALRAERSQHLEPVWEQLRREGHQLSIERVGHALQRGGNDMLHLRRT